MATTESLSHESHADDDHHHDHPAFLAHHFDTPEQQFDSGKLGMWLFLVTEVLFFSGLFCAYAVYRALRPEVFIGSSEFLNTQLGAINTGVLLFSSLSMAWAVRCSQTEEYNKLIGMLGATIGCATIFLGVKAIEYSHKIELGLLPAGEFTYDPNAPHHAEGISIYLVWMSVPFALALLGTLSWYVTAIIGGNKVAQKIAGPLTVAAACYFVGVGLGTILESGGEESGAAHAGEHADGKHHGEGHVEGEGSSESSTEGAATGAAVASAADEPGEDELVTPSEGDGEGPTPREARPDELSPEMVAASEEVAAGDGSAISALAEDATNTGVRQMLDAELRQAELSTGSVPTSDDQVASTVERPETPIMNPAYAGVFFSIYYCMTGVHAIHILAGIGALTWLLVRAARLEFNRQYFGPVDYVGLYWHIVDLIWIYLFPLLYLIG